MRGFRRLLPKTIRGAVWRLAIILLTTLGLDAFWFEPSSIRSVTYPVQINGADSANLNGLRIAVIADLHAGAPYIDEAKIQRVVTLTQTARPDIILLAGDYVAHVIGHHEISTETIAADLKPLHAPLGVYAVLGNHDHWSGAPRIASALRHAGIVVLENQSTKIRRGLSVVYLVGIDDRMTHHDNAAMALRNVPSGASALCLTHSPDLFPDLPTNCVLTIAGHTHGGQVNLPIFGRLIVPSKFGQHYAAGLIHEHDKYLFVSTGIGTSFIPVRFGVPPEVTVLEIH